MYYTYFIITCIVYIA